VENIIHGKKFVWHYFLIGLTIAITWTFILYKIKQDYFDGGDQRASAIASQYFAIIALTIFLNAFYTYYTGKSNIYYKEAILIKKGNNVMSHKNYAHLLIDGRKERFNPKNSEYNKLTEGDTLLLKIGNGKNEFSIIYEFKKK